MTSNDPLSDPAFSAVDTEPYYSPFLPLLILVIAILGWSGFQAYSSISETSNGHDELLRGQTMIHNAQMQHDRLFKLAQDVVKTGQKDTFAAQIVKEFNIQITPPAQDAGAPAAH